MHNHSATAPEKIEGIGSLCSQVGNERLEIGAGNEIRTRDPNLGKVVLYQLSYSRSLFPGHCLVNGCVFYGLPFGRQ